MEDILEMYRQQEADMNFRHPWVNFYYNWVIALLVVALFVSFVVWGLDIRTERKAEAMTAQALASWQADQDAVRLAEEEEQQAIVQSQEYVMSQEATALAKAFYGIRLFREKYNYSESDLATYARCIFNRSEGNDLVSVVSAPDQFVGYSDSNAVLTEDYNLAYRLVQEWHNETTKPCDVSYQFAELTPQGIFLKQDLHADGYARRWQA